MAAASAAPLPVSDRLLSVCSLHVHVAAHSVYGFSELPVQWGRDVVRLGRIGPGVLRCYDASSFADDDLLSRVRQVFPTLTEALLIADDAELPPAGVGAERIAHAIRLVAEGDSRNGRTERRP